MCDYFATSYSILNRDLLLSSAILHDIGKVKELSDFPDNDYTDEGQLIGHIVIGVEMIDDAIRSIPDFPVKLAHELKHCIVAHHGELEYGSPKKPALAEAVALQQPPSDKGKRLKLYYMTQVAVKPPTFVVFVNDKELMHFSYTRYLENKIRDAFGFKGTSLKFLIRERKGKDQ